MEHDFSMYGLSDKESRLYQVLLEIGAATVKQMTEVAGVNRTTGYDILNRLIERNLISLSKKGKKTVYIAQDPEALVAFLELEFEQCKKRLDHIRRALPELKAIYNPTGVRPKVKYFEGVEGLKKVYEDSLNAKGVIRAYASNPNVKKVLGVYVDEYYRRRVEKGIYVRGIVAFNPYALELKRVQDTFLREVRLVPQEKFDISLEGYTYDDRVSFISVEEKFGVIIESKEIANAQKRLFELAWQAAKKYDAEIERKLKVVKMA